MTELSKAFYCIPQNVIIAGLETYLCFHIDTLKNTRFHLLNKKQSFEINET